MKLIGKSTSVKGVKSKIERRKDAQRRDDEHVGVIVSL